MVSPGRRGLGIGKAIYAARRDLTVRLGLARIRAGARLRGYHRVAHRMSAADYVDRVVRGLYRDPTLSFQLREGFRVLGVAENYLRNDPESLGWAAVIEWLNPDVPQPPHGGHAGDGHAAQRGTMPGQSAAPGASGTPKLDTTTGDDVPGAPGTTANSAA
jgi:hypothetical protein